MGVNKLQIEINEVEKGSDCVESLLNEVFDDNSFDMQEILFYESKNLMAIYSSDGYFKKVSRSLQLTLGYTENELLSTPIRNLIIEEDSSVRMKSIVSDIKKGKAGNYFENIYSCKDGGIKWIRWKMISDSNDKLMFIVGWDITPEKKVILSDALLKVQGAFKGVFSILFRK